MPTLEMLRNRAKAETRSTADYVHARQLVQKDPAALDDFHIGAIAHYGSTREAEAALAARETALHPRVEPAPVVAAPAPGVEFPTSLWADTGDPAQALKTWSEQNPLKAVPLAIWHAFVEAARLKREALEAKVDALETKLAEIETRGVGVSYAGVFDAQRTYARGSLCTKGGALWLALRDNGVMPGSNPDAWKLVVKSGDAR